MPSTDLTAYGDVLSRVTGVSSWTVTRTRSSEQQRYLLAERPEAERAVDRSSVRVAISHDHDGGQGGSSFVLHGDAPLDASRVEEAVFRASLEGNPPYELPEPRTPKRVESIDPALEGDARPLLDDVQERVFAAVAAEENARLSASEIFVSRSERELLTSKGVHAADGRTTLMMELTLVSQGAGGKEAESFGGYTVHRLADLPIEETVVRHARRARHKLVATLPSTGTPPVVMSEGAFTPLLGPFTFATSGRAIYRRISPLEPGASVFGEREVTGDPFTLVSDPTLPFAAQSRGFDGEGLVVGRVPVIEKGIFTTIVADKRYADYLEIEPTGAWHNRVLSAGTASLDELLAVSGGPLIHVVEFSWLNPDGVRGNFSTEIRLGYEHDPSGAMRVVSGGGVAGNCYDAFANARYTRETELVGSYFGPKAIRFGELRVTGA